VTSVWDEVRRDFPALERWRYLNAAAASPTPRPVTEAVARFYRALSEGGDAHWGDWLAECEAAREAVARMIGAQAGEIAFVPNTSTGMNVIADLLAGNGAVLSDELEFPAVTLPWIHRAVPVHFLPAVEGVLRLESFHEADAPRAATIAVSQVQFSNGCRLDLTALGRIKGRRHLVVSASQGLGAFPVNVVADRIDALACAGHKWLCAGYGAGFVYLSRELLAAHPPRAVGWRSVENPMAFANRGYRLLADARRHELGCPSFGAIFALKAAALYLTELGADSIAERVLELNLLLTSHLAREGFTVHSPGGEHRSGQTLVEVPDPPRAVAFLEQSGVLVTEKPEGVRISTHFYNDEADVEACVRGLVDYRRMAAA
jgi:selenocysteine lyase/cysteine desulfurase